MTIKLLGMRMWLACLAFVISGAAYAGTLEDIRSSGVLQCGVDAAVPEFSASQVDGVWQGLPVVFCQALALAVIGDSAKINFTLLGVEDRVEALQAAEVDILVTALPISASLESRDGLLFSEALFANTKTERPEHYAAAVRQGDDAWFVAVKWLRHLLVLGNNEDCATYDDVVYFEKNWGCEVLTQHRKQFSLQAPD
jgi:ABC-type amino acid transport substrate-binding protein